MTKRAVIYLRCSTREQSTAAQRAELEAVAARAGWTISEIYEDAGISGAKGRDRRPAFDRLLRDATQRRFDIVLAWSVDRLARSLQHLVLGLAELQAAGVDLFLRAQHIDISTPNGRALFGMLGIFSEFEREILRERVKAGLDRARVQGTRSGKPIGRPQLTAQKRAAIRRSLAEGLSIRSTASLHRVGVSTVQRLGERPPLSRSQSQ